MVFCPRCRSLIIMGRCKCGNEALEESVDYSDVFRKEADSRFSKKDIDPKSSKSSEETTSFEHFCQENGIDTEPIYIYQGKNRNPRKESIVPKNHVPYCCDGGIKIYGPQYLPRMYLNSKKWCEYRKSCKIERCVFKKPEDKSGE